MSPAKASFPPERIVDVAGGVAGRLEDAAGERADLHRIALADCLVDQRDALRFLARRDHAALMALLRCRNAGGVIAVMVRDQNIGEPPAGLRQRRLDRRRLRRIDGRRGAGLRIVDEHAEIVGQAGKQMGSALAWVGPDP